MCDNSIEWCKSLKMHFKWVTNMLYGVECFKMSFRREAKVLNILKQQFQGGYQCQTADA